MNSDRMSNNLQGEGGRKACPTLMNHTLDSK